MHSASFYGRRPSYVAASWNRRLYPIGDQDPRLTAINHDADEAIRLSRSRTTTSATRQQGEQATQERTIAPDRPPPVYFRGDARRRQGEDVAEGMRSSINSASSQLATIAWERHIAFEDGWLKYVRPVRWWRVSKREKEVLSTSWPKQFSVWHQRQSHDGTAISCRSEPDSGIAISPCTSVDTSQHPLAPLFVKRIDYLNQIIPETLVASRTWLAALEVLNLTWLVLLVISLGVDKGDGSFLRGVAIAFVMIIIVDGAMINAVRMRRWALLRQLRLLSRDWSPLPITSSTAQGLVQNFLGIHDSLQDEEAEVAASQAAQSQSKDEPTMRWSMLRTEGGWWLSWRPIVRVELITPSTAMTAPVPTLPRLDEPPADLDEDIPNEQAPAYTR